MLEIGGGLSVRENLMEKLKGLRERERERERERGGICMGQKVLK